MQNRKISLIALVVANLFPLMGAIFWHWSLAPLLISYWLENVAIGFWTIIKIKHAEGTLPTDATEGDPSLSPEATVKMKEFPGGQAEYIKAENRVLGWFLIPFFIFHYGLFTLAHGVFIFALLSSNFQFGLMAWQSSPIDQYILPATPGIFLAFAGFLVSHGISYFQNYIGRGECKNISSAEAMAQPYSRIVVMHLVIIFGAFLSSYFQINSAPYLLIAIKLFMDIRAHLSEHNKLADRVLVTGK